jgi:GPH family glycoside/pentoside/hexuronide:cation symporter
MSQVKRELQKTAEADKIPVTEKVAYGSLQAINGISSQMPHSIANQVFNMSLGIAPSFVTGALAFFRLFDAITDPLIGWLSDSFRSRWGRRRPFMLVGIIGMSCLLPLLFNVNPDWSTQQTMMWFIGIGLIYYLFDTMLNVPSQSLGLEMSPDYNERTSIQGYRSVMGTAATIGLGWLWYLTQLPIFADPETGQPDTLRGAQGMSLIIAGLILVIGIIPLFICKERYYAKASLNKRAPFWKGFKSTIGNKPFRLLLILIICMQIPNLVNGLGMYMATYYVFDGDQKGAAFIGGIGNTVAHVLAILSVPLFAWLSRRFGKEKVLRVVVFANIFVSLSMLFIYNPNYPYLMLFKFIMGAPLITGLWMMLPSMQADVVDQDELECGQRREGAFASVFSWTLKFSATFAFGMSGVVLDLIGFDVSLGGAQGEGVYTRLLSLLVGVPILATMIQLWVIRRYPLTPEIVHDIRDQLEARRGKVS